MGELLRRIRAALVGLLKECAGPESLALLVTTLVLVTRNALASTGYGWPDFFWSSLAKVSSLFEYRLMRSQVVAVVLQFVVPVGFIWLVHRGRLKDFGLGLGDWKFWLPITAVVFLIQVLVVAFYLSKDPVYVNRYPSLHAARGLAGVFWAWELSRVFYMISWEFLFRGYLLFALRKRFGLAAVVIQMVPFVLMHIISNKPVSEVYFTIFSGLISGLFALEGRSVWPVIWLHAAGAILLDIFIVFG
jgi:membrane protease YdiL (CAAX protease family)